MQIPPASVLSTWPTPNYVDPTDTRGPAMLILTLVFMPLSALVVLARVYTRVYVSRSFGADDVCIVIAMVFAVVCTTVVVLAVQHLGWNRHIWDVPVGSLENGLKYTMTLSIAFAVACQITKLSLLFFIRRMMSRSQGLLNTLTLVMICICASELLAFALVVINTCRPVKAYFVLSFGPQQCIDEAAHLLAAGVINTVTDFLVVLLPIPTVLSLNLSKRQQIVLVALFAAGFVTVFAGAVRIYYTYRLTKSYDKTWWAYPLWISGVVEMHLGIIAASLPATKKLISRYLPKLLGSSAGTAPESDATHSPFDSKRGPTLIFTPSKPLSSTSSSVSDDAATDPTAIELSNHVKPIISTFSTWQVTHESVSPVPAPETPNSLSFWKKAHPAPSGLPSLPPTPPPKNTDFPVMLAREGAPTLAGDDPPNPKWEGQSEDEIPILSTSTAKQRTATKDGKTNREQGNESIVEALGTKNKQKHRSTESSISSISSFNVASEADSSESWENEGPFVDVEEGCGGVKAGGEVIEVGG